MLAWLIDFSIISTVLSILTIIFSLISIPLLKYNFFNQLAGVFSFIYIVIVFILYWFYFVFWEIYGKGRSVGKIIFKIRVIDLNGKKINFWQSMLRNLIRLIDMIPFFYLVGIIFWFSDKWGRRLGDILSKTCVVKEPKKPEKESRESSVLPVSNPDKYLAALDKFTEKDFININRFLDTRNDLSLHERSYWALILADYFSKKTGVAREHYISPEKYLLSFLKQQ